MTDTTITQSAAPTNLAAAVREAWAHYERTGEVCSFEGNPMIYASVLEDLEDLRACCPDCGRRIPIGENCPCYAGSLISAALSATPQAPAEPLTDLFREALAFGLVYGPEIPTHQWDEMRDTKARQLAERATPPAPSVQASQAVPSEDRRIISDALRSAVERGNLDEDDRKRIMTALAASPAAQPAQAVPSDAKLIAAAHGGYMNYFTDGGKGDGGAWLASAKAVLALAASPAAQPVAQTGSAS